MTSPQFIHNSTLPFIKIYFHIHRAVLEIVANSPAARDCLPRFLTVSVNSQYTKKIGLSRVSHLEAGGGQTPRLRNEQPAAARWLSNKS